MTKTIEAVFDGTVFRPDEEVGLAPNTRVRITIESPSQGASSSFLRTARSLKLDGPPDWAENLDQYLYGGDRPDAD